MSENEEAKAICVAGVSEQCMYAPSEGGEPCQEVLVGGRCPVHPHLLRCDAQERGAACVRSGGASERGAIFDDDEAMRLVRYLVACGYSPSQVEQAMRDLGIKEPDHG